MAFSTDVIAHTDRTVEPASTWSHWNNVCQQDGNGNHWVNFTLTIAGAQVAVNIPTAIGIGVASYGGGYWQGHINAGGVVTLSASQNGGSGNGGGSLVAAFIPTPAERFWMS